MIVGLTGLARAGKDTIAKYLVEKYNFKHLDFARDALFAEADKRGIEKDKMSLSILGDELRQEGGRAVLAKIINSKIKEITQSGIFVFTAPHMLYGRINPNVYSNLRELYYNCGAVSLKDMLPETAFIKRGWVLGHTKNENKVKEMMLTNYAGEFNERGLPEHFLY